MNIPEPQNKGFTVYTKFGCAYCVYVKQLLKTELHTIIECDDYLSSVGTVPFFENMQKYLIKTHKTFPLVFYKGVFIGGFAETKKYIDAKNAIVISTKTANKK